MRREGDPLLDIFRGSDDHLSQLVRRDYLSTLQQAHNNNNDDNNSDSHPLPVTLRNRRWIRVLKLQQSLLQGKPIPGFIEHMATENETAPESPSGPELIFHLLQQCTRLQRLQIEGRANVGQELESWRRILGSGLPGTLNSLTLDMKSQVPFDFSPLPPILFSRCSSNLQELSIHMRQGYQIGRAHV